jgi:superfamily II DNA/RNA helicase
MGANYSMEIENIEIGTVINCRKRDWVVVNSNTPDLIMLRPLVGSEIENVGIHRSLIHIENIKKSELIKPDANNIQDFESARLLYHASRFLLRNAAGPIRAFSKINISPRPYQLVPLMMAMKQEVVRLLIADDVGVGKTIEASLVAKEMIERDEIERFCILCPPHLSEQWQKELKDKFNIDAEIIKSGTINKLQKRLPSNGMHSVFSYYKYTIVSLDYVKTGDKKQIFLNHAPELIIVDEAHTCAKPKGEGDQQLRHELVSKLAEDVTRHMLFLTATPHSGIEESFRSILSLLNSKFEKLDLANASQKDREDLAKYFCQRGRADIEKKVGNNSPFPEREEPEEVSYEIAGSEYKTLFDSVYKFAGNIVKDVDDLGHAKKRGRFWSALAIMRSVVSSPASAIKTIQSQKEKRGALESEDFEDSVFEGIVYDPIDPNIYSDSSTVSFVNKLTEHEIKELRRFEVMAKEIGPEKDTKFLKLKDVLTNHLNLGYHPVVFCRYIPTANYLAENLRKYFKDYKITSITGEFTGEERQLKLEEIGLDKKRILIATDCLSEGMNLQDTFSSVIHYDLPWNPNRLEQREGRVDRYGQRSPKVKATVLYGKDNRVDGAVLEILLRKVQAISKWANVRITIPSDSKDVTDAIIQSLFNKQQAVHPEQGVFDIINPNSQQTFFDDLVENKHVKSYDNYLKNSAEREKLSRSIFAQNSVKFDEEIIKTLEDSRGTTGSDADVEHFYKSFFQKTSGLALKDKKSLFELPSFAGQLQRFNGIIRKNNFVNFNSEIYADQSEYVGRSHKLTTLISQYLFSSALKESPFVSRTGVIRTKDVTLRTTIFLVRLRYGLKSRKENELLAEECLLIGYHGRPNHDSLKFLKDEELIELMKIVTASSNLNEEQKKEEIGRSIEQYSTLKDILKIKFEERSLHVQQLHSKIRESAKLGKIKATVKLPEDLVGMFVLIPEAKGIN